MFRMHFFGEAEARSKSVTITLAASFASGTPMALLTNGTVCEARGLMFKHVNVLALDRELHIHQATARLTPAPSLVAVKFPLGPCLR